MLDNISTLGKLNNINIGSWVDYNIQYLKKIDLFQLQIQEFEDLTFKWLYLRNKEGDKLQT